MLKADLKLRTPWVRLCPPAGKAGVAQVTSSACPVLSSLHGPYPVPPLAARGRSRATSRAVQAEDLSAPDTEGPRWGRGRRLARRPSPVPRLLGRGCRGPIEGQGRLGQGALALVADLGQEGGLGAG